MSGIVTVYKIIPGVVTPVGTVRVSTNQGPQTIDRVAHKYSADGKKLRPYFRVYHGHAYRTSGGLLQKDLRINKWGKIVSKKKSQAGSRTYAKVGHANLLEGQFTTSRRSSRRSTASTRRRSRKSSKSPRRYSLGGGAGGGGGGGRDSSSDSSDASDSD